MSRPDQHAEAASLLRVLEPGTHVIEASAGTGKTHTITSLVAAALALGVTTPARVLTVTFTRAATAELRVKVRERLVSMRDAIATNRYDDALAMAVLDLAGDSSHELLLERLDSAIGEADAIGVDTIHGWCATLLGQYGDLLGIETAVTNEPRTSPAHEELTERGALAAAREVAPASWLALLDTVASPDGLSRITKGLLAGVGNVHITDAQGQPIALSSLTDAERHAGKRLATLHAQARELWSDRGDALYARMEAAIAAKRVHGNKLQARYLVSRARDGLPLVQSLTALLQATGKQLDALRSFGNVALREASKDPDAPLSLNTFGDLVDELLEVRESLAISLVTPLVRYVETVRSALPRDAGEFDDLLRLVAEGIDANPDVAVRMRRALDLVFVDESQDTDPLQWRIFASLFHNTDVDKRLVLVGDPKQSIYRFRNAEVAVYLDARRAAGSSVHSLGTNFRSDPQLVHAVNAVCLRNPDVFGTDVTFTPVTPQRSSAELVWPKTGAPNTQAPFTFVEVPSVDPTPVGVLRADVARDVARRIAALVHAPVAERPVLTRGGEPPRAIGARDCAVLVSSNKEARLITRALLAQGVHAVANTRQPVTGSDTAHDLHLLLTALETPADRGLVRTAALTPLLRPALGIEASASPAAALRHLDGAIGDEFEDALREARTRWEKRGVLDAWITLDRRLGLSCRLAGSARAERQLTDARHLLELLARHEARQRSAPSETIRWLAERRQQRSADEIEAEELEERLESDEDAVRVLTVHASKGLEFPLVWVPYAWTAPNVRLPQKNDPMVRQYDATTGRVEGVIPLLGRGKSHPVSQRENQALLEEKQRLLYVALTRARNVCTVYVSAARNFRTAPLVRQLCADTGSAWDACVELAAAHPRDITLDALQTLALSPAAAPTSPSAPPPVAAAWARSRHFDTLWRRGSFTGLVRSGQFAVLRDAERAAEADVQDWLSPLVSDDGVRDDERASDEGEDVSPMTFNTRDVSIREAVPRYGEPVAGRVLLADVPRGRAAGNALHETLEKVMDSGARDDAALHVISALTREGLDADVYGEVFAAGINRALDVPIRVSGMAPTLRTLAQGRTFPELSFDLAVVPDDHGAVHHTAVAAAFARTPGGTVPDSYAQSLRDLAFTPLRGVLTGSIDLVAQHDGRWLLLDYKSNHLGDVADDYRAERLTAAMCEHHYVLQYHLYLVALHRFLRQRIPDYDYTTHVAGIAYLFVRGMDGGPEGFGVFTDQPPLARIEALDALLRQGGSA